MGDKKNPVYDIPADVSSILFYYLMGQNEFDLIRLKEQYEEMARVNPEQKENAEIVRTIGEVLKKRKGGGM